MLFLKFLDDLKAERQDEAELDGRDYAPILAETYRWRSWAAPKTAEGRPDRNAARTGEDSLSFGGRSFGNPDPWAEARGFGIRGSFRYIGERDDDDYGELEGLDDIDAAYEVGLGAGYAGENYYVFADVRRGFGGHEAWVGEVGADAVFRPSERLRVTFGPRAFFGSDDYASTYFDVSAAEAAASSFNAYDADGGLISTGVELGMRYKLSENWGLSGAVTYDRFRGDAEDSPIVQQGSEDQWGARLGVTRTFSFGG